MNRQPLRIPKYRHHKHTNRAVVTLDGREIYLGVYDSLESHEQYKRLIAEWLACGGRTPPKHKGDSSPITVVELCAGYWRHAQQHYRRPDGTPTDRLHIVQQVVRRLRQLYGPTSVAEFGPLSLRAVRQTWIEGQLSRRTVNDYTAQLKLIFRWGVADELVPETVHRALTAVPNLQRGRSAAHETEPKRPVPDAHIRAVQPHVSRQVWALVQLQLATAGRGGELVIMRPVDLDMSGPVWIATLSEHKTAYRGKEKVLYLGPQAQMIVGPFLSDRPVDAFLFSPKDAEAERHAAASKHRRPNQQPSPRKTQRKLGDRYTSNAYRRAIERACKLAGVPHWHPHRLRHNAATTIRREAGIEAARIILGHASGDMTELYAERDRGRAIDVMREIG